MYLDLREKHEGHWESDRVGLGVSATSVSRHQSCRILASSPAFLFSFFSVKDVRIFRCFFNSSVDTGGRWLRDSSVDDADREDQSLQLKALLHVAATRAKEHLRISWAGRKSKFLPEKVWSR